LKALVKFKSGAGMDTIKCMDMPEPSPGKDELKIRVLACGICGTDIHIMKDEFTNYPPVIMGHEYIGVVSEKGGDVKNFDIGDYVISLTAIKTCGTCTYCHKDLRMLCANRQSIGCFVNGAMAEYVIIPADMAFKVPENIEDKESLAISEPATCVVRAVIEKSSVKAGDVVVVSGPGAIGQLAAQLAKISGAYVIVSGLPSDAERLKLAKKLGADQTVTSREELDSALAAVTRDGADVVFECAGAEASARTCIDVVKKTGIYSQVGLFGKDIKLNVDQMLYKELSFTSSFATERTSWETYLRLVSAGKLQLSPLISKKMPLEQYEEAFDLVMANKGFKIVLIP